MTENPFKRFWQAGYKRLLPIVPPGSPISEKSTLAKRPGSVGKAPGIKRADGTWQGVDLRSTLAAEADLELWHAMGAGIGIRTGEGLVAVDIDTLDEELADQCHRLADLNLAETCVRIGRAPKRLLVYRVTDPVAFRRVKFEGGHVELLSDDRQFVAHGIHPATGQPYSWPVGVIHYEALPLVTPEQLDAYFALLVAKLPKAEQAISALPSAAANVDQRQLLGEPETVTRAVTALPNTSALFPTYDDYVRVGYAIKGATQDDALGLELFQQWAAKWDGENDPDRVAADWQRMKPPYHVGAQYLYSLAEQHSGGAFRSADSWFESQPESTASLWDQAPAEQTPELKPIEWFGPTEDWGDSQPEQREWLVKNLMPAGVLTLLYGDGGVGKTLAAHQLAICVAAGLPWLGQETRPGKVMGLFCEDAKPELHRRHVDIVKALGVDPGTLRGRLRISSRSGEDNILAALGRGTNTLQRTPFWHQLAADILDYRPDVVILDTLADIFGGSEIDRAQVNYFVKFILGNLVRPIGATLIVLGQPSVAGKAEGRSGSTAWSNAARSRVYLRWPKGEETGNNRELEGMKSNYGPKGAKIKLRWQAGAFTAVAASTPGIDLNALKEATNALAGGLPTVESAVERGVLAAVAAAQGEEVTLSPSSYARDSWAPKAIKRLYGEHVGAASLSEIDDALAALQRRKLIVVGETRRDRKRVPTYTLGAAGQDRGQPTQRQGASVFD